MISAKQLKTEIKEIINKYYKFIDNDEDELLGNCIDYPNDKISLAIMLEIENKYNLSHIEDEVNIDIFETSSLESLVNIIYEEIKLNN